MILVVNLKVVMMEKVGLEVGGVVGGEVSSRDGSSVGKDVKDGFNVRIDNIIF